MTMYKNLTTVCAAVVLAFGLAACGGGDDEEAMAPMEPPAPMEPVEPAPPPGPTDLEETQAAAAAAASDAMMASANAAASASGAEEATMTLATLQTGADSNAMEMGGREATDAAHAAATEAAEAAGDAAVASAAAAAATTAADAEAAWRMAENAKDAAEAAEATAAAMAEAAITAAMTELHVEKDANGDYTLYSAGEEQADGTIVVSSVDTKADKTTSPTGDQVTGFIDYVSRDSDATTGRPYIEADGQAYRQAVAARSLKIGKVLDTSDDTHRLTVIHSRATSAMQRVYVVSGAADGSEDVTDGGDGISIAVGADGTANTADDTYAPLKSLGMYIEAADIQSTADTVAADTGTDEFDSDHVANDDYASNLDHGDQVAASTKPKELFSYVDSTGNEQRVVETSRTIAGTTTTVTYRPVDTMAGAAPDIHDPGTGGEDATTPDENPESIVVRASIPEAVPYAHINFGVWGMVGAAAKDGSQKLADLGTGFVQNISDSGMTDRLGIGTVMYEGQWVAHVQRQNATAGTGAINPEEGEASMTANFDTAKFTATLTDLATLTGTLDGNGFSGMMATVDEDHTELDPSGDFKGEFSGGIYGSKGEEAAGVFDFNGGEAGAFVGAFGGTNQN